MADEPDGSEAVNVGTRMEYDIITQVDFSKRPFTLHTDGGKVITADSVIIATGAQARWLGLESEQTFNGKGVSACATCDGFLQRQKSGCCRWWQHSCRRSSVSCKYL